MSKSTLARTTASETVELVVTRPASVSYVATGVRTMESANIENAPVCWNTSATPSSRARTAVATVDCAVSICTESAPIANARGGSGAVYDVPLTTTTSPAGEHRTVTLGIVARMHTPQFASVAVDGVIAATAPKNHRVATADGAPHVMARDLAALIVSARSPADGPSGVERSIADSGVVPVSVAAANWRSVTVPDTAVTVSATVEAAVAEMLAMTAAGSSWYARTVHVAPPVAATVMPEAAGHGVSSGRLMRTRLSVLVTYADAARADMPCTWTAGPGGLGCTRRANPSSRNPIVRPKHRREGSAIATTTWAAVVAPTVKPWPPFFVTVSSARRSVVASAVPPETTESIPRATSLSAARSVPE